MYLWSSAEGWVVSIGAEYASRLFDYHYGLCAIYPSRAECAYSMEMGREHGVTQM